MKETYKSKKRKHTRKFIWLEMQQLKADVREAYAISAQLNTNKDFEATEEELKKVEDQALNIKLLEKLENMRDKLNDELSTSKLERDYLARPLMPETTTLLHFFYLVRLAQQGFFYIISGANPALEPRAVTYVCDTMMSASIHAARSVSVGDRTRYKQIASDIFHGLLEEKDEPVAEGFKTTFKDIMTTAHKLMDKSLQQKETSSHGQPSAPLETPPVWFIMPFTSMIDSHAIAMPGTAPSLPFPAEYLHNGFMHQYSRKQNNNKNRKRGNNDKSNEKEREKNEKALDVKVEQVEENKENEPVVQKMTAEEEEKREQEREEEEEEEEGDFDLESSSDDDDRFADPDMSDDDDDESVEEDEEEEQKHQDAPSEQVLAVEKKQDTPIQNQTSKDVSSTVTTPEVLCPRSEEAAKANTDWLNFAASSPDLRGATISSQHLHQTPYYKTKK